MKTALGFLQRRVARTSWSAFEAAALALEELERRMDGQSRNMPEEHAERVEDVVCRNRRLSSVGLRVLADIRARISAPKVEVCGTYLYWIFWSGSGNKFVWLATTPGLTCCLPSC